MTRIQKIIKYLAIIFAIFLSVNIISSILFGTLSIIGILNWTNKQDNKNNEIVYNKEKEMLETITDNNTKWDKINTIKINIGYNKLEIKEGNEFKIETNNKNIKTETIGNNFNINENKKPITWNINNEEKSIIIYLPQDTSNLKEIEIITGAGETKINNLNIKKLKYKQGAGKTILNNVKIEEKFELNGGAGNFEIINSEINNADIELGAGKFKYEGILKGNNEIEAGVGKIEIALKNRLENYKIKVEKGIGAIRYNNENINKNTILGNGTTYIDVDGGIGEIEIK